jgi:excisionase family DNA binding protein
LLTTGEVAAYLNLSVRTLERWRASGTGPRWIRVYHSIRYRRSDLAAWMAEQQSKEAQR